MESCKKCQAILKLRKMHNLKYKDIILPHEYTHSGYHREYYKVFTGLKKKNTSELNLQILKKDNKKKTSKLLAT